MSTIKCIVVDDEPLAARLIEGYVRKTPFLSLEGTFTGSAAAFEFLHGHDVDLLFCDIQMPGLSGMELSRMLPERTRIIFTTAFSDYALEGFKVRALDYLLKPVSYEDFLGAALKARDYFELAERACRVADTSAAPGHLDRLDDHAANPVSSSAAAAGGAAPGHLDRREDRQDGLDGRQNNPGHRDCRDDQACRDDRDCRDDRARTAVPQNPRSIFVKTEYRLQQIELDKITYIEGLKDYVKIHLDGGAPPVLSLMRLKSLEDSLPQNSFVRVHKSFIVRLCRIDAIERNHIIIGQDRIPIGESYQSALFRALSGTSLLPK